MRSLDARPTRLLTRSDSVLRRVVANGLLPRKEDPCAGCCTLQNVPSEQFRRKNSAADRSELEHSGEVNGRPRGCANKLLCESERQPPRDVGPAGLVE